jgi:hypothetical protein
LGHQGDEGPALRWPFGFLVHGATGSEADLSIETYAARIRSIEDRHAREIVTYAQGVRGLLPTDMAARRAALARDGAGSDALAGVAGVVFGPREHALTLAWALDPVRSGLTLLTRLTDALGLSLPVGPLTVSHDSSTVDERVFDVRIDADGWRLGLVLGEAPTHTPAQMRTALDAAFGAGAADHTHLVWLTTGGGTPGAGWTPLTWRTLDQLLEPCDVPTVTEYRRVLAEQVFRRLTPSAVRRNLDSADHRALCSLQEARGSD